MIRGSTNGMSSKDRLRKELEELEAQELGVTGIEENQYIETQEERTFEQEQAGSFEWPLQFTNAQLKQLGRAIRDLRIKRGHTQMSLERLCDFKVGELSLIELGRKKQLKKAMVKKIGHVLRDDFNLIVQEICSKKYIQIEQEEDGFAFEREEKYRASGQGFDLRLSIDGDDFKIINVAIDGDGEKVETLIYKGKKMRQSPFFQGIRRFIAIVEKGAH